ncbi:MAG: hypothetical protein KDB33_01135 [Acidimicrobiales bacterium]|nr:hypothetical protein [Acidimicrobiales bacterium]
MVALADAGLFGRLPIHDAAVGVVCGAVGTVTALAVHRRHRDRSPARTAALAVGPLAASAVVWAVVAVAGGRAPWLLAAAAALGLASPVVADRAGGAAGIALAVAALVGGAVAAAAAGIVPAVVLGAVALAAWPATSTVARHDGAAVGLVLLAATGGLFLGVPDVEDVAATGGALSVAAVAAVVRAQRGAPDLDRPLGSAAALAVLVWLAATSSLERPPVVVGAGALLALAAPAAIILLRRAAPPTPARLRWTVAAVAAVGAVVIARFAMVGAELPRAVVVAAAVLVASTTALALSWRGAAASAGGQAGGAGGRPASDR